MEYLEKYGYIPDEEKISAAIQAIAGNLDGLVTAHDEVAKAVLAKVGGESAKLSLGVCHELAGVVHDSPDPLGALEGRKGGGRTGGYISRVLALAGNGIEDEHLEAVLVAVFDARSESLCTRLGGAGHFERYNHGGVSLGDVKNLLVGSGGYARLVLGAGEKHCAGGNGED